MIYLPWKQWILCILRNAIDKMPIALHVASFEILINTIDRGKFQINISEIHPIDVFESSQCLIFWIEITNINRTNVYR